jgi:hypothetical protein
MPIHFQQNNLSNHKQTPNNNLITSPSVLSQGKEALVCSSVALFTSSSLPRREVRREVGYSGNMSAIFVDKHLKKTVAY